MSGFRAWLKGLFSRKKKPVVPPERVRRAAESIIESEGLTANLDDEAAKVLLAWGVARAKAIARATAGMDDDTAEVAMYPRMRALRRLLRAVNRWIPRRLEIGAEGNRSALEEVLEYAAEVYGEQFTPPDEERVQYFLFSDLPSDAPRAIQGLRHLLENREDNE